MSTTKIRQCIVTLFLCLPALLQAQNNLIVYSEPTVAESMSVDKTMAKVIILSPNKDLLITHNMGDEKGVLAGREQNGEYRYELTHILSEDEAEDGFCKSTVTVTTTQGSKSSTLVLKAGKCYIGKFEIPFKFSCIDESNTKAVYPYENRAKVSFISEENNLKIKLNGTTIIENGVPTHSVPDYLQATVGKDKDNPELSLYDLIFDTSCKEAQDKTFLNPTFTIYSSFPTPLEVKLKEGAQLNVKTAFKFRILLQLVETVIQTKKVLTSATMQLMANAESASNDRKYIAAQGFYQQALDSLNNQPNSSSLRDALKENISHMAECAQWDQKAAKYMEYIKQVKESKSEDKMTVIEDAFQQTLTCYSNLDRLHPDPVYKRFIEKIEKALETFNFIIIEGTVRDRRDNTKIITGGMDIYGVHSSVFTKEMQKKAQGTLIGSVDSNGKFRVQVDKGTYTGLLLVPTKENKDYDKNGFVSLAEQKHLKTTVYISE